MLNRFLAVFAPLVLVSIVGCGGATDFGEIGKINGTITHQGKTVPSGTKVIFMMMETGYAGYAFTGEDGTYSVAWRREGETYNGLPVGTYKVLVEPPGIVDIEELSAEEMLEGKDNAIAPPTVTFDKKYTQTSTSGLEFTIVAGENIVDIALD